MRRARETAAALELELGVAATELDYVGEWRPGETFGELLGRVRRLRAELEANDEGLPLLVGHGIFFRLFLLDAVLGGELADSLDEPQQARAMERIWHGRGIRRDLGQRR
jgi:broad specificity phosphatase PhoE